MYRIATLSLTALLAATALTGCEKNASGDKQAVEEIVAQRLEAEKAKTTLAQNETLVRENAELKAKVTELEGKVRTLEAARNRVAQAATPPKAEVAKEEQKKQVQAMKSAMTGAGGK